MKTKFLLSMAFVCFLFVMNAQTTKMHEVTAFTGITVSNGLDIYVTQGNTHSIKVEATDKQHEKIKISNGGDKLYVAYKGKWIRNEPIKVYVTIKNLESLTATGGSDIYLDNNLKTEKLSITLSGGSDLSAKGIDATKLSLVISGGSDVMVKNLIVDRLNLTASGGSDVDFLGGSCNKAALVASGGSDIEAEKFKIENSAVTLSGGSDATIHVTDNLKLVASGASDITCHGNPTNVTKTVSKSSDVEIL